MLNAIVAKVFESTRIPFQYVINASNCYWLNFRCRQFETWFQDNNGGFDINWDHFPPFAVPRSPYGTDTAYAEYVTGKGLILTQLAHTPNPHHRNLLISDRALVYHHWDIPGVDAEDIRDQSRIVGVGEWTHHDYSQLHQLRDRYGRYWNADNTFKAALDCQDKRTGGGFPQDWNGRNFYPKGPALDFLTDVQNPGMSAPGLTCMAPKFVFSRLRDNNLGPACVRVKLLTVVLGACAVWNMPICKDMDDRTIARCNGVFAATREGYCGVSDCSNLGALCSSSYFVGQHTPSYSSLAMYCLVQTGYLPDDTGQFQHD